MKKNEIIGKITKMVNKTSIKLKKHSPEILIIAGVTGTVVSTVLACKATTKLSKVLEEHKKDVDAVHECADNEKLKDEYTTDDAKKDLTIIYAQTGVKIVKLYAPAVVLGALSLTSIIASNNILKKRNIALTAAYATVNESFKKYRSNVVERYGEQIDQELRYGIKAKKFEETIKDAETGKEKKVKSTVNVVSGDECGYARYFDNTCEGFENDTQYNLCMLRANQQYANNILQAKGYIFLNDVYDMLGIPRTKAGQMVGWVYRENNEVGDNFVDFGILETNRETENGSYEPVILLDFNPDGNILDLI